MIAPQTEAPGPQTTPGAAQPRWLVPALMLIVLAPLVLWPANAWWLNDETRLIANAWHANDTPALATHGLVGNFRITYGPFPTQVYQALLAITHDLAAVVVMRALLTGITTALALLWLARTLGLPRWFCVAIMISPFSVLFHRVLWDASFTIPLGTLALAAFAAFLKNGGRWPFRIALAASFIASMVHPQALPVFVPLAGIILWRHRRMFREDRRGISLTAAVVVIFHATYFVYLAGNIYWLLTDAPPVSYPGSGTRMQSAFAPLFGGALLGADGFPVPFVPWFKDALYFVVKIIHPIIWTGIAFALAGAVRAWKNRASAVEPRDMVCLAAIAGLAIQTALFIAGRVPVQPQYYFGSFAIHAFFALLGMDAIRRLPLGVLPGAAYGAACAVITFGSAWLIEHDRDSGPAWPTVRDAREVATALNQYEDVPVFTDIPLLERHQQAIRTMRLLMPPPQDRALGSAPALLVTYERRGEAQTGRMIVRELDSPACPPGAGELPATPLPAGWVPPQKYW